MWTGPESNWRHTAFQAVALPTELPVQQNLFIVDKYNKVYYLMKTKQGKFFQELFSVLHR